MHYKAALEHKDTEMQRIHKERIGRRLKMREEIVNRREYLPDKPKKQYKPS